MIKHEYLLWLLIDVCTNVVDEYEKGNIMTKEPKHAACLTMLANRLGEVERSTQVTKETRTLDDDSIS